MDSSLIPNYVCVHCGSPIKCLFKKYSPTVLKLVNCDNCDNVADKYLEYDEVIILIDIILFKKQAYRHLLFNTRFKNHWKLALLILCVKTSDEWFCYRSSTYVPQCLKQSTYEHTIYTIYCSLFITVLGKALFFCIVSAVFILWNLPSQRDDYPPDIKIIWKAIISSSFGYFLLLPSLIWSDFQREIHLIFICIYTLLSHIQALTVVFKVSRPLLAGSLIFAGLADYGFCRFLRCWFHVS